MTDQTYEQIKAELIELELRRCKALGDGDTETLAALYDEDLIFIHGKTLWIDDMEEHIRHMYPRITQRGELSIRLYGDIAIMDGPLKYIRKGEVIDRDHFPQVWIKRPSGWKFLAAHTSVYRHP